MRILLASDHEYPANDGIGSGLHPRALPSGSGYIVHDLLAKGLAESGQDVFYSVLKAHHRLSPPGVNLVVEPRQDVDVVHFSDYNAASGREWQSRHQPWVTTCHLDNRTRGMERATTTDNWIFVSRTLAQAHGYERYVWNGIDPAEYIYNESKDDYFLFMSSMNWGSRKGLDVALSLSKQLGFKLVIAGTAGNYDRIRDVQEMCREVGAVYVGDVRGKRKAELLAGARGFLFPTEVNEAFGLGMVEALMSGTPVICSDRGACPEIISPEVGFVCRDRDQYVAAIERIADISPRACRDKAMKDYHYRRMAADYVVEYEKELGRNGD